MASQTSAARYSRVPAQEPSPSTVPPQVQRISIRAPKNLKKKYNVMRFNRGLNIDFEDWKQIKMHRENNMKHFKDAEEEIPTFGAGSEFGRAAREQARRRRYGIKKNKYNSENQPWILKNNEKNGKKYKGVKEGGVNDNAAYYIFSQAADGAIEAYPLHEWYNFQMVQSYKTLSAEEAEEEFSRRDRVMNYFSLMLKKRLKNAEEDGEDAESVTAENGKKPNKKKEKDFKISEMDEWIDSDDDSDDSDNDDKENRKRSDNEDDDSKKKKKGKILKKKAKRDSDDEAVEESDDGDEEGRELDYISDSSASESELELQKEIKSVAEEKGLKQLLDSDDEDEDENKENSEKKSEDGKEEEKEKDDKGKEKSGKSNGKETSKKKSTKKETSHSSDMKKASEKNKDVVNPSRKRNLDSPIDTSQCKRFKTENNNEFSSYIPGASESGITEEAVKRYLMRKPMTTTDLLQKFKSKKTGLSSEKIVTIMTAVLKKLNPTSQKIKGKMYFSIQKAS